MIHFINLLMNQNCISFMKVNKNLNLLFLMKYLKLLMFVYLLPILYEDLGINLKLIQINGVLISKVVLFSYLI
jgi:hypothetical protein